MARTGTAVASEAAKRPDETDRQWRDRLALLDVVRKPKAKAEAANDFTQQHGDYRKRFVTHVETGTRAQAHVNRGGTPLCRWIAANKLTDSQLTAIDFCMRLWRLSGLHQRVTASYGERLGGFGSAELSASNEIEAREDLHRLRGYFPGALAGYFDVFENVCRHGMAASEAGEGIGYVGKSAGHRAHLIVCFVADTIAMRERL